MTHLHCKLYNWAQTNSYGFLLQILPCIADHIRIIKLVTHVWKVIIKDTYWDTHKTPSHCSCQYCIGNVDRDHVRSVIVEHGDIVHCCTRVNIFLTTTTQFGLNGSSNNLYIVYCLIRYVTAVHCHYHTAYTHCNSSRGKYCMLHVQVSKCTLSEGWPQILVVIVAFWSLRSVPDIKCYSALWWVPI